MKKIFLLLFAVTAFAQTTTLPPGELSVSGTASAKVAPDEITFTLKVSKENKAEAEALKQLNAELDALQQYISKSGIPMNSVKITDYSVISVTLRKSTEKAFVASATLSAEMKLDYKVADRLYTELQSGKYKDVNLDYTTSLSEELQKATSASLIEKAIADARANADNMARVLGVKISGIKRISKSESDTRFYRGGDKSYEYVSRSPRYMGGTILGNSELGEKELEDQVVIIYEISK